MDECGSMQDYAAAGVVLSTGVDNLSSHISFPKSSSVLKPWRERERKNIYIYIYLPCYSTVAADIIQSVPQMTLRFADLLAWN